MPSETTGRRRASPPSKPAAAPPAARRAPSNGRPSLAEQDEYIGVLFYGNPGYSKTTCAATMATLGRVIYVDAEHRLKPTPLRRVGEKLGLDIPLANIEPYTDVSYQSLLELTEDIRDRLRDGEPIVGVVIDSISELHRELLMQNVDDSVAKAIAKNEYRHPTRTFQEDYGDMTEQTRRILRRFRSLPLHLAMTALPRHDVVQGQPYTAAGLTPALLRDVQGMMDFILYMDYNSFSQADGDDEYSALTRALGPHDAKDTFGVLPYRMVNPTFPRLLAYVNGELTPRTDPLQAAARDRRKALAADQANTLKTAIQEDA